MKTQIPARVAFVIAAMVLLSTVSQAKVRYFINSLLNTSNSTKKCLIKFEVDQF